MSSVQKQSKNNYDKAFQIVPDSVWSTPIATAGVHPFICLGGPMKDLQEMDFINWLSTPTKYSIATAHCSVEYIIKYGSTLTEKYPALQGRGQ